MTVAVPRFLVAPHVIAATDLIATLATRVAHTFPPMMALALLPPPVAITGFTIGVVWHERTQRDPAQRWLRDQPQAAATVDARARAR